MKILFLHGWYSTPGDIDTVKKHVTHIFQKLGVTDRTQAALWAIRNGLV
jgi:DNA-binding NarL/FixJ family response regulator